MDEKEADPGSRQRASTLFFNFSSETTRLWDKTSRTDVIDIAKRELGEMVEHARRSKERMRARAAYEQRKERRGSASQVD